MDGWTDGWMDRFMDGWKDVYMDECIHYGWMDSCVCVCLCMCVCVCMCVCGITRQYIDFNKYIINNNLKYIYVNFIKLEIKLHTSNTYTNSPVI